jgi:polysaccharide biosynthesis/export protein
MRGARQSAGHLATVVTVPSSKIDSGLAAHGRVRRWACELVTPNHLGIFCPTRQELFLTQITSRFSTLGRAAALTLSVAALAACGSAPSLPAAPATVESADYSYVIGAGDNLQIIVWRNPELSQSVPVRPDGKVAAPLVDELVAQGKTPPQLARDIEKKLSTYVRDPVVTVIVNSFVGPYSEQIRVVGEAAKPQFLPYKQKMTLLDVMIAVGGLTDFADGNSAIIQRSADANKQYAVRLKDLIRRGDTSANVEMRPGDILIIPQSFF